MRLQGNTLKNSTATWTASELRADIEPKATEHIKEMIEIVKGLIDKGYAYERTEAFILR